MDEIKVIWNNPEAQERWDRHIASTCYSMFEGCCCQKPKGHTDRHECVVEDCKGNFWTDEDEKRDIERQRGKHST